MTATCINQGRLRIPIPNFGRFFRVCDPFWTFFFAFAIRTVGVNSKFRTEKVIPK